MNAQHKYEQLIRDMRQEYRVQRDWGEGRGIFLVIGHFMVGVAAGTWLLGLFLGDQAGLLAALALAALGGVAHLGFLGHPERFWRMARHVRSSWISRGFVGLAAFLVGATAYLIMLRLGGLDGAPWTPDQPLLAASYLLAAFGAAVMMGYMGFCYTASKAIPFWHSSLQPVIYIAYALRGGAAALIVVSWLRGAGDGQALTLFPYWSGATAAVALFFLLELHAALTSGDEAARRSVTDLLAGRLALYFYCGILALGLVVPAFLALRGIAGASVTATLAAVGTCSVLGDFFMKYSTVRAGVHRPVWSRLAPARH